jgi:SAM-dependent methyltransferase
VLDAGCGGGRWTLELAARRPAWFVIGLDRDPDALTAAERGRRRLGLTNVAFVRSDFREFHASPKCDVVLSVCSAHYLAAAGEGREVFGCFQRCLKPGGRLLLYGPRRAQEAPFASWLPPLRWHDVFSSDDLLQLCRCSRLRVERLSGCVGRSGTLAKQLDALANGRARKVLLATGLYAIEWVCVLIDNRGTPAPEPSLMWLLVASAEE